MRHNRRWRRRVERLGFLITGKRTPKELPGLRPDDVIETTVYNSRYDPGYSETKFVEMMWKSKSMLPSGTQATLANTLYVLKLLK